MSNSQLNYEEEYLTHRDHLDPDKHWIGESLGSPSIADLAISGSVTATGDSPFVARSDHMHDIRPRYMNGNSTAKSCAGAASPGQKTYIDTLAFLLGYNMLNASTQLIIPALAGIYFIQARFAIVRSAGTFPATTAYRIQVEYNGGATPRTLEEGNLHQGRGQQFSTVNDYVQLTASGDLQFSYTNFDSGVNHNVTISGFMVMRQSA